MKFILIAAILAAIGIAIVQHSKLSDLNAEAARMEAGKTPSAMKRADRSLPMIETPREATAAQFELVRETMIEAMVAHRDRTSRLDPQRWKQALLAGKDFSGKDIGRLVELLGNDPRLAGIETNEIIALSSMILSETPPVAWREFIEANRDLQDWQNLFDSTVRRGLQADAKRAIEEFEKETARGNPDFTSSGIRTGVLLKLAASDPDKMLALAASPEFAADPDALAHLGGFVDDQFEKPEEHHRFLASLRRATERHPDSPLWQTIRKEYVREMTNKLPMWPFEQMKTLVDGELSREEKLFVAEQASHRGDLDDKEKWADWFLGIDPGEWDRWIVGQPQQFQHPVIHLLSDWGRIDVEAASAWLEKMPSGELRSKAAYEHAWTIAERHPDRAAGYLAELPESKEKQDLVKKIGKARR
jgi:hypothetical protein